MSENKSQPRLITDKDLVRPILKQIKNGKDPHKTRAAFADQDVARTIETLVEFGLVDHLSLVSIRSKPARPGSHFLTDKGIRWLRTYDRWERFKYAMSRWQLLGGILIGLLINFISGFVSPYLWDLMSSAMALLSRP